MAIQEVKELQLGTTSTEDPSEKNALKSPLSKIIKALSFPRGIRMMRGILRIIPRRSRRSRRHFYSRSHNED